MKSEKEVLQLMCFQKSTLQWIQNMLLSDEMRLKDIPPEIRTSSNSIYITALRIGRSTSCRRYVKELQMLCQDIHLMGDDNPIKDRLLRTLSDALNLHGYQEDKDFVDFQNNIYENVLRELQTKRRSIQRNLNDQLRQQRFEE